MMKGVSHALAIFALMGADILGAQTKAPAWDARGTGPLPWQGVSALAAGGGRIVLGTTAPPGDPNVIVLDAAGKVVARHAVGQRWIDSVALLPDGAALALCTHADGKANDFPTVFVRGARSFELPSLGTQEGFATSAFHYGGHSNHLGLRALSCAEGIWVNSGNVAHWHATADPQRRFTANLAVDEHSATTAAAVLPDGTLVVGHAVPVTEGQAALNLHALRPDERRPLWSRMALVDLPRVEEPERGAYGAPTRRNGQKLPLDQWDVPVSGPLSIALHAAADGSLARVATAEYRGWQRWVRSSATMNKQQNGTRMMPSRPVVCVHDAAGRVLRRFEPESFAGAAWLDLRFARDGRRLLAWPHRWNSRGLGGMPFLPADAEARTIYELNVESGDVRSLRLPDAVADLALASDDAVIVSCWDGGCHRIDGAEFALSKPVALGAAALLGVTRDDRIIAARADGIVIAMDGALKEQWRVDLNQAVPRGGKPWVEKAAADPVAKGLWGLPGGRTESDLGGQRVIEAPEGLILIEGHAGLSFEREWAAMRQAGLDPMRVKFVLTTHEHGDHSPGAALWRATTGAQFVCSEEMAYTLQHHIPLNTGYGFHPPVPADIVIKQDAELDLAGLKVRAIRAPGHTAGSMAWSFEMDGKRWLATGDLIMPHGPLGYSGSINFSAQDVLASLRKLQGVHADFILPGHGPIAPPPDYLGEGIETGTRVGWGKMPPSNPDPRFRISQPNVIVAAWNQGAASAAFGDFNRDGKPDIAVVCPTEARDAVLLRFFFNHDGKFADVADKEIVLPGITDANLKLATAELNGDGQPDFVVSGGGAVLLLSDPKQPDGCRHHDLPAREVVHVIAGDDPTAAPAGIRLARRFGALQQITTARDGRLSIGNAAPEMTGAYLDLRRLDANTLVSSYGHVIVNGAPPLRLLAGSNRWHYFAVGDFNGDHKPDVLFAPYETALAATEHLHTGDATHPFRIEPSQRIAWPADEKNKTKRGPDTLIRDTIAVADWNRDGFDDVVLAIGQSREVHILPGGKRGLDPAKRQVIALDYHLHYETGIFVADFDGDGKPDIAALGYTETGVGTSGPLAVYIWCQR
jgi:glyoxylase-like metal-dependent hydrolase (beta-lactamase superfamily II)